MIGLHTNVLVRYLVRDDPPQYEKATRLMRRAVEDGEPIMVSLLTLLEMERVLRSWYASSKEDIAATISSLLDAAELTFEDEPSRRECGDRSLIRPSRSALVGMWPNNRLVSE